MRPSPTRALAIVAVMAAVVLGARMKPHDDTLDPALEATAHVAPDALPDAAQRVQRREIAVVVKASVGYWLYLPPGYHAKEAKPRRWPLIVFLHGSDERGADLAVVRDQALPRKLENNPEFPFVVVSPQAPAGGGWDPHVLHALLERLKRELRIDPDRVTATGLSMGGFGVWNWATEYPQDLAAIAPISGYGDEDRVCGMVHVPVWAFHGADDPVVPIEPHQRTVAALRDCGGQVRWTVYPDTGHDAWTETYDNPALYKWLAAQVRPAPAVALAAASAASAASESAPP